MYLFESEKPKTVRLTEDIWDDGEDHHPPGYLAYKGEVLEVVTCWSKGLLSVRHTGNPGSFVIRRTEYEYIG